MTLLWIFVFVISLAALIKASEVFTKAAEEVGVQLGMPPFVVGVTIVGTGTSLPELVSSLVAVIESSPEIVAGNVFGSNIANILLIFGAAAILARQSGVKHDLIHIDLPLLLGSAFFLYVTCFDGLFTTGEALLALAIFVLFITYSIKSVPHERGAEGPAAGGRRGWLRLLLVLLSSGAVVLLAAHYTIQSVIVLSMLLGVGADLIAVSAVAIGTSLPELAVSMAAVRRGNLEMVIGNVLGSNIFNTFAVMGSSGLIDTIVVTEEARTIGLTVVVIASMLFFAVTQDRRISRWEGWFFVLFYLLFIGKIFGWF